MRYLKRRKNCRNDLIEKLVIYIYFFFSNILNEFNSGRLGSHICALFNWQLCLTVLFYIYSENMNINIMADWNYQVIRQTGCLTPRKSCTWKKEDRTNVILNPWNEEEEEEKDSDSELECWNSGSVDTKGNFSIQC